MPVDRSRARGPCEFSLRALGPSVGGAAMNIPDVAGEVIEVPV